MAKLWRGVSAAERRPGRDGGTNSETNRISRPLATLGGLAVLSVVAAGCATDPKKAGVIASPRTPPTRNITSFTPALQCMDDLFASYGMSNIVITSAGIPDATGKIKVGTKDMMISAISKMSIKSNAFRFVDFARSDIDRFTELTGFQQSFVVPNYYIRGAITQLDRGVASDRIGGGVAFGNTSIGVNRDQMISLVSMDLNMGDILSRQILPGVQANNQLAIVRQGQGADLDAKIGKFGVNFNMAMDRSEGAHQSVRTLVQLSLIEILGKLTKVPYWKCLEIPQTNPEMRRQAQDWYDTMKPKERTLLVQRALIGGGYMNGKATGVMDAATRTAASRFQAENNLIADGRVNFDIYYGLLGKNLILAGVSPDGGKPTTAKPGRIVPKSTTFSTVGLQVSTNKGARPTYRVGEKLVIDVKLAEGGYVYCYYQDANKKVARIFPNRFAPDAYLGPRKSLRIPDGKSRFDLVMERSGVNEQVDCIASRREVGIGLSPELQIQDLTPIRGKTMKDVIAEYKKVDRVGIAHKKVSIRVTR